MKDWLVSALGWLVVIAVFVGLLYLWDGMNGSDDTPGCVGNARGDEICADDFE